MEKMHINQRGTHTTVIEAAKDILSLFSKGSRQEFKVFTVTKPEVLVRLIKEGKKMGDWNVNYTDMRGVNQVPAPTQPSQKNLDAKYAVKKGR